MKKWLEIATENLLSSSVEQSDFDNAKKEWVITEHVIDNYMGNSGFLPFCELCHHEKLRWQFEIQNKNNNKKLLVGSTCITKFDIPVSANNTSLFHGKIRDGLLLYRIKVIKEEYIRKHIADLFRNIRNEEEIHQIQRIEEYWNVNNCFTPIMATLFITLCEKNQIDIHEVELSISLKRLDERIEVLRLSKTSFSKLLPFLNDNQIKRCKEIRKET
jgi:hypothetical protein